MKVFKRDKSKKYVCDVCGNQFNWNKNSSWLGQLGESPESIVCSDNCKSHLSQPKKWKKLLKTLMHLISEPFWSVSELFIRDQPMISEKGHEILRTYSYDDLHKLINENK